MKNLFNKVVLIAAGIILSSNFSFAGNDNKIENDNIVVTRSTDFKNAEEFNQKLKSTLKVLRTGMGSEKMTTKVGDFKFVDFKKGNKVARLVINEKKQSLKLVQRTIKR